MRLDRIETKVDGVNEKVSALAVAVAETKGEQRARLRIWHGVTATIAGGVASFITHFLTHTQK
jgi:hypothetical protein